MSDILFHLAGFLRDLTEGTMPALLVKGKDEQR